MRCPLCRVKMKSDLACKGHYTKVTMRFQGVLNVWFKGYQAKAHFHDECAKQYLVTEKLLRSSGHL